MRFVEFEHWLSERSGLTLAAQSNARSRCRRVERYEGDLDQHFASDGMAALLVRLRYSSDDERIGAEARHSIPFTDGANVRNGTASLADAVRLYLRFSESWPPGTKLAQPAAAGATKPIESARAEAAPATPRAPASSAWPEWVSPTKSDLLQLARITVPYVRFLHPDIVRAIVEDNEHHRPSWETRLRERCIDPAIYLWERSACAFPGVRRYAGSTEIARHRGRMDGTERPEDALRLDDNNYPKHVWSFVFRAKVFQNQGPAGYSLAHLADHKLYKNRGREEFDVHGETIAPAVLFGLYTSAANTVYTPNCLIRPTDYAFPLRNLIQRQADHLYGGFCNLLPPGMSIRAAESGAWSLDAFDWSEAVGTMDHVPAFLSFRIQEMDRLFSL